MINKTKNILIVILITIAIVVSFWGIKTSKKNDSLIKKGIEIEKIYQKENDSLLKNIEKRDETIIVLEYEQEEHEKLKNDYISSANYFKSKYRGLIKNGYILPEKPEDSLKVALIVSENLFNENINLRIGIKELDSAYTIQKKVVKELKLNIIDYKINLDNQKEISKMWKDRAIMLDNVKKKEKVGVFLKGGLVGSLVTVLVIIVLL